MRLIDGLPAMPPVPLELLFPEPWTGKQLVEAPAPRFVGDPACPVCHAMLHYTHQGGYTYRAVCSRSDHATRLQTEPKHLRCRWLGWLEARGDAGTFHTGPLRTYHLALSRSDLERLLRHP